MQENGDDDQDETTYQTSDVYGVLVDRIGGHGDGYGPERFEQCRQRRK
jgi:hypothetical protein